jgi:acyl transferase domain-containing protein/NAD(P)H-dependent flavin oxidoreductase YrpB (nitropropane dioxygenase family)/NAD(P)-dependent dehydrogenase (short-subunit alcohol dehydrogenase family)
MSADQDPSILVLTLPGWSDSSVAIAASRAGAVGVLDLEYASCSDSALRQLARLTRFAIHDYGVKLGPESTSFVQHLHSNLPPGLKFILLAGGESGEFSTWIKDFRAQGIAVLVEATTVAEAKRAAELGASGIVLKGHESGGRIGEDTAFILFQRCLNEDGIGDLLLWVQGGIGLNTAAACVALGAAGVVLDAQVMLTRESPLDDAARQMVSACDGSETRCLGESLGQSYRCFSRPDLSPVNELAEEARRIETNAAPVQERAEAWRSTVRRMTGCHPRESVWLVGQDLALAASLAERFATVGGIVAAVKSQIKQNRETARRMRPLAANAPMAQKLGTRYPLLQGPMTRVSDTVQFAESVAEAGALPFLALALMRGPECEQLLKETKQRLGERHWGAGLLGFLPPEIRQEQLAAVRAHQPPYALIAGGRPDQARELEKLGIPTFLHVPSPALLRIFLRDGARRFVFEGRECGGHVGPRSSFVLWESMIDVLLEHLGPKGSGKDLEVVFAGGIHDDVSAAMVSVLAAPLVERGVAIGGLMGTAYLFTQEAVASGGITERFQNEALQCGETVLLETGPGHAIRCLRTPYYDEFQREKQQLQAEGRSAEEITRTLERRNVGRLRIASKGLDRVADKDHGSRLAAVPEDDQYRRGMYMIGQVASMRHRVTTMAELHEHVCRGAEERLERLATPAITPVGARSTPSDIAIVGMSCFYPGAHNLREYWENVLARRNAVTEVPPTHWDWRLFYDPDPKTPDRMISKWGGFVPDIPFDPLAYGITPKSMECIEPLQLLLLEAVKHALEDAGYSKRPFDRERTAAILGIGGGGSPLALAYGFRACMPLIDSVPELGVTSNELMDVLDPLLPHWTEDSFPGFLMNVAVGRVANRFNLGGPNMAIDAACASSLAAVHAAVRELETGSSDVAFAMGADTVQTPFVYTAFSKTHALSPQGRCRPFDAAADGIALSEGIGVLVLKRLADAERDGDRIYAVIKGSGASSDGRDKGLTAPNVEGQVRALRRAYEKADLSLADVELIEAHGTGTVVGDRTESESLNRLMHEAGAVPHNCALGSVKSMIGHSKCAAGTAGLIKTALALYHQVLPPTLVDQPNPNLEGGDCALYLNTEPRPWVHGRPGPRTAGVSAFGFGGTNVHVVIQEYTAEFTGRRTVTHRTWPAELFIWRGRDRAALKAALEKSRRSLTDGAPPNLRELAISLWKAAGANTTWPTAAIVAGTQEDLLEHLTRLIQQLDQPAPVWQHPTGAYFAERPADHTGKIAVLFPGQGSQYPDMLASLAVNFPCVRDVLDRAEAALLGDLDRPLGRYIYPASPFSKTQRQAQEHALAETDIAQPAIGAASLAAYRLLQLVGVKPDVVGGHSYGEYTALCAAGTLDDDELFRVSYRRGQTIRAAADQQRGAMAAIPAATNVVEQVLAGCGVDVVIANRNSPQQTVISGSESGIQTVLQALLDRNIRGHRLPVSCAFHSPLVAAACRPFAEVLESCRLNPPRLPVYSNTTGRIHEPEVASLRKRLAIHLESPVRFEEMIEAMYADGVRTFIEAGPQSVLTGLVQQILRERPHCATSIDRKGRDGMVQLQHSLAQLIVHGVPVDLTPLYAPRQGSAREGERTNALTGAPESTSATWLINGARARPVAGPEPVRLGQRRDPKEVRQKIQEGKTLKSHSTAPPVNIPPVAKANMIRDEKPSNGTHSPAAPTRLPAPQEVKSPPVPQPKRSSSPQEVQLNDIMLRFQDAMVRFLDTQREVMQPYLTVVAGGAIPTAPTAAYPTSAPRGSNGHSAPSHSMAPPVASQLTAAPGMSPPAPTQPAPAIPASVQRGSVASPANRVAEYTSVAVEPRVEPPATSVAKSNHAPPSTKAPLTLDGVRSMLLKLLSERTGYPIEMLDPNLELEGDLGIDSIKRVEILAVLAESLGEEFAGEGSANQLEELTSIKTLQGILDYIRDHLSLDDGASAPVKAKSPAVERLAPPKPQSPVRAASPESHQNGAKKGIEGLAVKRGLVELIEAPRPGRPRTVLPRGAVVLTDDGGGVAAEFAARLADFGQETVILRMGSSESGSEESGFQADLTDLGQVQDLTDRVRQRVGRIGGLIHAWPLRAPAPNEDWSSRARDDVKSLHALAQSLEQDLRESGSEGGAFLLAPTGMGGELGFRRDSLPEEGFAGYGGIVGFAKCLALEWPDVLIRAVDLDRTRPAAELVDCLAAELDDPDGPLEVGCHGARRVTWRPVSAPLGADTQGDATVLNEDSTVLITGGARGITAEIAVGLAQRYRPKLALVGRSPLPQGEESPETAQVTDAGQLKSILIQQRQRDGQSATPGEIETIYRNLLRDREIRNTLKRIEAVGGRVRYYAADVRDENAVRDVIADVERTFGPVTGVIHGAGVIDDKLVRDKTPQSLERVFDTKVRGAANLMRLASPERLKFCVFFSSIASRFGNVGQADYAAANEVLSKLAADLDRRWPGRVAAIAWGPWANVGMVSHLEKHLTGRGVALIPPAQGVAMLIDELVRGGKGDVEVIIGGGEDKVSQAPTRAAVARA